MYQLHFSIDDVVGVLRWIYENMPQSIFETRLFGALKKWHELYGIKVSLYLFASDDEGFFIKNLQPHYIKELLGEKQWLKISYHGVYGKAYVDDEERFIKEYQEISNVFAENFTSKVRLHCWYASEKELKYLKNHGVRILLCPPENDREHIYNLNTKEKELLYECREVTKNGINYVITDLRLDYIENVDTVMCMLHNRGRMNLFLHEWRFDNQREVIDKLLRMLSKEDVEYI